MRKETERGRTAEHPHAIPRPGWRDVLVRVKNQIMTDKVTLLSAGVAFYGLLALFPGIAVLVSLYGLIADHNEIAAHLSRVPALPTTVKELAYMQLQRVTASEVSLPAGLVALSLTFWSASRATNALIIAVNIAYEERDQRSFFLRNAIALLFTMGAIAGTAIGLFVVTVLPAALGWLGLTGLQQVAATTLPWIFLPVAFATTLSLLYRFGPHRAHAKWRWITPGAVVATALWVVSSMAFSAYVGNFGKYNEIYGSVGAVVVLILWFWISAFVVILGAEINAETEHQTRRDSTMGPPQPMGDRGAYVADHEGPIP